jgi:predicted ATPase
MYVENLRLRNFKCHKNVDISLPKITLLTGANSSGKSSILYGLLSPFQSPSYPFYLSANGEYVNMGDFDEIVYCGDKSLLIGIDVDIKSGQDSFFFKTDWTWNKQNQLPKLHNLDFDGPFIRLNLCAGKRRKSYVLNINYDYDDEIVSIKDIETSKALSILIKSIRSHEEKQSGKEYPIKQFVDNINNFPKHIKNKSYPNLQQAVEDIKLLPTFLINSTLNIFDTLNMNMNFISSFREEPERTYYQKFPAGKINRSGDNYIDQIVEWENQETEKLNHLKDILKELNLTTSVRTRKLKGGRFELRVKPNRASRYASLSDVGFGISQFLPIAVADLQLDKGSTLIVAQPEIHLHPQVQASLANYFVSQSKKHAKRYIVETHSEYLLNRIRLLIVKGELRTSDVATYYLEKNGSSSELYPIKFTKKGTIEGAPPGFFETYMMDVMDIAMNAA